MFVISSNVTAFKLQLVSVTTFLLIFVFMFFNHEMRPAGISATVLNYVVLSQELINLLLLGTASSNMWDGDKAIGEGAGAMQLRGGWCGSSSKLISCSGRGAQQWACRSVDSI